MAVVAAQREEPPSSAATPGVEAVHPRRGRSIGQLLVAGGLVGVLESLLAISFGGLIFAGALASHTGTGVGVALFSGVVALVVIAWRSSLPGTIGSVQDVTAAVLVVVAAGVVSSLGPEHPALVGTVLAAIALTTALTGASLWLFGWLRLGQLSRFVPYPVVGGFLAGTGWLLLMGGISLLDADGPDLSAFATWIDPAFLTTVAPGVALALVLFVGVRRGAGTSFVPIVCVAAVAVFYLVVLLGPGLAAAEAGGWLLGPFPDGGLWPPDPTLLGDVEVGAILAQLPSILTVVALTAVALLLNASGIELMLHEDADLDRELRTAGVANLAAAAGGGIPGFHALSLSNLAHRAGGASRATGFVAAGVVGITLVFSGDLVGFVPRPVVGGLLVFLGLAFLAEWLIDGWAKLVRADYAVVALIVVVIAAAGFLQGVAVGIAVTVALFLVTYSRADVVRLRLDGDAWPSNVDRPSADAARLQELGGATTILQLHGFLFFGTANRLLGRIGERIRDPDGQLRYLVLDLHRVAGLDSSALLSFQKAAQLAVRNDVTIVLAGLRGRAADQVARGELADLPGVQLHDDVDHAVQWCEDQLLGTVSDAEVADVDLVALLAADLGSRELADRLGGYLVEETAPAGRRLIVQGEQATDLYFLRSGRLTVTLDGDDGHPIRLRTMLPGTVVGEVATYLDLPRSANVDADTDVVLHRLSANAIARAERDDPDLAAALHRLMARHLATRLRRTLRTLSVLDD